MGLRNQIKLFYVLFLPHASRYFTVMLKMHCNTILWKVYVLPICVSLGCLYALRNVALFGHPPVKNEQITYCLLLSSRGISSYWEKWKAKYPRGLTFFWRRIGIRDKILGARLKILRGILKILRARLKILRSLLKILGVRIKILGGILKILRAIVPNDWT